MRRLTSLLLAALLTAQLTFAQPPAQPAPGNRDIEAMLEAGIGPEVIAAKIRASAPTLDAGAAALRRLKDRGATDALLIAVVESAHARRAAGASDGAGRTAAGDAAVAESVSVVLPAGTPVEVESAHAVNSAEVREGDAISFRVVRAVEVGGLTLVEAGAHATGRVVSARKGKSFGRKGELAWRMESVVAADGRKIPLSLSDRSVGHSKGATVATAAVLTGVVFWPAAPLWGFKKGKNAIIPAGKIFAPVVQTAATVNVRPRP